MDADMNEPPAVADPPIGAEHFPGDPGPPVDELPLRPRSSDAPTTPPPGLIDRLTERLILTRPETWISLIVVGASMAWILSVLHPRLILADTTPTGGDMGAHVWAPAYLRDHLLPKGRLIGWTPDWYDGFPAFQFYMIVPSLAIVMLNVGLVWWQATIVLLALAAGLVAVHRAPGLVRWRKPAVAVAVLIAVLCIGMPYGVAFKIIVVSGLVTMPLNAWAMGRLSGMAFPGPVFLAVATLPFVFDRSFNIYGGNIASTMAGEFAFSMGLSMSMLAIGLTVRAIDTGEGRAWAAIALAFDRALPLVPGVLRAWAWCSCTRRSAGGSPSCAPLPWCCPSAARSARSGRCRSWPRRPT